MDNRFSVLLSLLTRPKLRSAIKPPKQIGAEDVTPKSRVRTFTVYSHLIVLCHIHKITLIVAFLLCAYLRISNL